MGDYVDIRFGVDMENNGVSCKDKMIVTFCKCGRILTTQQKNDKLPCEWCQKKHAEGLKDRLEESEKKEE